MIFFFENLFESEQYCCFLTNLSCIVEFSNNFIRYCHENSIKIDYFCSKDSCLQSMWGNGNTIIEMWPYTDMPITYCAIWLRGSDTAIIVSASAKFRRNMMQFIKIEKGPLSGPVPLVQQQYCIFLLYIFVKVPTGPNWFIIIVERKQGKNQ